MNITIVTNILPYPLSSGGAQAQFNMIDRLRHQHSITMVFTQDGRNTLKAMHQLQQLWPEVRLIPFLYVRQMLYPRFVLDKAVRAFKLRFMPTNERFQVERTLKPYGVYFSRDFIGFVNRVVRESHANMVQVEFFPCLPMARYLPKEVRKIFVHHEIRYIRNERLLQPLHLTDKERMQADEVRLNEIADLNRYDQIITLTSVDKQTLEEAGVCVPISVSPAAVNAVELPYREWNGRVTFVGGYGHIPNQEGIEWFENEVEAHLPEPEKVKFDIIGGGWPTKYADTRMKTRLLGFVESLPDVAAGTIMVVPILTGSGMRMKILEAAAMSLPFVTTSVGVEGLDFVNEESCLIADRAADFARALHRLMTDAALREKLGRNANKLFVNRFSAEVLARVRNSIYL